MINSNLKKKSNIEILNKFKIKIFNILNLFISKLIIFYALNFKFLGFIFRVLKIDNYMLFLKKFFI